MKTIDGPMFKAMITSGYIGLQKNCKIVNDLNVFPVPDGDTGFNMGATMKGGVLALENFPTKSIGKMAQEMSRGMLMSARGNSGVILSQFFAGFADGIVSFDELKVKEFASAMVKGVKKAYSVVIKPVEGTILTVMREGSEYALSMASEDCSFEDYFTALVSKMREALDHTPDLLPILKEAGVIDSGGAGLLYIVEGMAQAIGGKIIEDVSLDLHSSNNATHDFSSFNETSTLDYGYCTEFILQLTQEKDGPRSFLLKDLISFMEGIGDSLVAFQNGTLVKVHVHTKKPDLAIGYALRFGDFVSFKMENMALQHNETLVEKSRHVAFLSKPMKTVPEISSIAVSPAQGLSHQFVEYGVNAVIDGTQNMNPDADAFIQAFKEVGSKKIIVLPNNKNEWLVAEQAKKQMDDSYDIRIVKTSNVIEGIACASVMDLADMTLEQNVSRMEDELARSHSIMVSKTNRSSSLQGLHIEEGDYLGLVDGKIVLSSKDELGAFLGCLDHIDDPSLVTVFLGKGVEEKTKEAIQESVEGHLDFAECYVLDGGQEIYSLLALVE